MPTRIQKERNNDEMIILQGIARMLLSTELGKTISSFFSGKPSVEMNEGTSYILVVIILVIILHALTESIARRGQRERSIQECWRGKSRFVSAFLALAFGFTGAHRFYLRCIITGILQCVGSVAFVIGAWLLGSSDMFAFLRLDDKVSIGLVLFLGGLAMQLWHVSDFFMILFGGMIPNRRPLFGRPHWRHPGGPHGEPPIAPHKDLSGAPHP